LRFHSLFNVRIIIRLKYETSSYLLLYITTFKVIFQFFLQKRYSEADFVMKVAWKIALYNLVFHQLPLIQHCSIFYKKNAFQSTKNFRRIQWQNMLRMASECISYNLEFQKKHSRGSPPLETAALSLCLWHSTLPLLYKLRLLLQFFLRTLAVKHLTAKKLDFYCKYYIYKK
jgi:hypothetical protein